MPKDDDEQNDLWPWNDKTFQNLQAEHERFMREIREREKQLDQDDSSSSSSSPLTFFKRFIDDNFSTLTEGFRNFPSNIQEIRSKMQREQERRREEELDISRRWTGSSDSPDHIQMELLRSTREERDDAHSVTLLLFSESLRRNANVPPEKIEALFEDNESLWLPTAEERSLMWLGSIPRWLSVDWFKRSPYSPIRLEAHDELGRDGAKWRAAFEDLLNATLDKPMGSFERIGVREPYGKAQSTYYGPGLEWLLSLQCRGILPPLLPRFYADTHGRRALREGSILSTIASSRKDLPWSSDISLAWHSPLHRDFAEMMSEIATKATPETEMEVIPRTGLQPESELDAYNSPHLFPSTPQTVNAQTKPPASPLSLTGNYVVDLDEAHNVLWDAIVKRKDANAAARILDEWYRQYQDVADLVHDSYDFASTAGPDDISCPWLPILDEALRQSSLPDVDPWKQYALRDIKTNEVIQRLSPQEERRRLQLIKQGEELVGRSLDWSSLSIEVLERRVESLIEQLDNLRAMTGEAKEDWPMTKQDEPEAANGRRETTAEHNKDVTTVKKPDVLSALTTTQTTRLPDGTVTTKVVLRKRFVDGREETTETVHTTNEELEQQQYQEEEKSKRKGWFWT